MTKVYTPHLRVSWGGALGVPEVEIWSNTVNFVDSTGTVPTEPEILDIAGGIWTPIRDWFVDSGSIIGPAASLKWLKVVWVLANGHQRDVNTVVHDFAANVFGTGNQGIPIWEQSYCLTLRTAIARGRSHSGRIYPPLNGGAPEAKTPYMAAGSANVMAANFATCLMAIQAGITASFDPAVTNFRPSVVSPGDTVRGTGPLTQPITGVVVDRVADIQHRRTNRVPRLEGTLAVVENV
jgi:hypothetical protein